MNEPFVIAVRDGENEHEFKARFERWGYTHRVKVLIGEVTVTFEPDEEGSYRALAEGNTGTVGHNLLLSVAEKLAELSK